MTIQMILLPLFVEVILTIALLLGMAAVRQSAFASGAVRLHDIALREPKWPQRATQVANSFSNQFELPVLFYVLTILSIITRHADLLFVILAWIFVLCRLGQSYVHVTSNVVRLRGGIYAVGAIALIIAWVIFMVRILLGLP